VLSGGVSPKLGLIEKRSHFRCREWSRHSSNLSRLRWGVDPRSVRNSKQLQGSQCSGNVKTPGGDVKKGTFRCSQSPTYSFFLKLGHTLSPKAIFWRGVTIYNDMLAEMGSEVELREV